MDKISCGICQDLIPLVTDEVAGEESKAAVRDHIRCCESCQNFRQHCKEQQKTVYFSSLFSLPVQNSIQKKYTAKQLKCNPRQNKFTIFTPNIFFRQDFKEISQLVS